MTKIVMSRRKPKSKLAAPRQNLVKVPYGPATADLNWIIKCRNATQDVRLQGKVLHALKGTAGVTIGCHLSNCGMDAQNRKAFGHNVLLVSVTKSRVVVITDFVKNKKGIDGYGVLYHHNYGALVDLNDEDKAKSFAKTYPDFFNSEIVFKAPRRRVACKTGGNHSNSTGDRSHPAMFVPRGALRRAVKAGLIAKPVADALEATA